MAGVHPERPALMSQVMKVTENVEAALVELMATEMTWLFAPRVQLESTVSTVPKIRRLRVLLALQHVVQAKAQPILARMSSERRIVAAQTAQLELTTTAHF